jgi:hypothetical protein
MGNNCTSLNEYSDICMLSECISGIQGLASTSTSNTDQWILQFKPTARYKKLPIKLGFLKWFVTKSFRSQSLSYEIMVYRAVIRPLIDLQICPNFVNYLGSSMVCPADTLINILLQDPRFANKAAATRQLKVNLTHMLKRTHTRPAIDNFSSTSNPELSTSKINLNKHMFSLLLTQVQTETSLYEWLIQSEVSRSNLLKIVYQIATAVYAMTLSKTTHNDLHSNNVLIQTLSKPKTVTYRYLGRVVTFRTRFIPLIYDFDRASVQSLGDNITLETDFGIPTTFSATSDMTQIICEIHSYLNFLDQRWLKTQLGIKKINKELRKHSCHPRQQLTREPVQTEKLQYEPRITAEFILKRISGIVNNKKLNIAARENTYICSKSMFSSTGLLKRNYGKNEDISLGELVSKFQSQLKYKVPDSVRFADVKVFIDGQINQISKLH